MSITSLIGTRLLTGIGALAIAGSVAGGTVAASKAEHDAAKDNPVRELRHELRDETKAERDAIVELRKQLAAEYAKDQPDAAKMERLHEAIEAKRAAIGDKRFEALMQMHDELDARQRERLAERMAGEGKKGKHAKDKGKHAKGKGKHAERDDDERGGANADRPERGKAKAKADRPERGKAKAKADKGKAKAKDRRPV
jgi:Spy/CpxP family protein refolding chaperone